MHRAGSYRRPAWRALALALFTWLPIAIWALVQRRAFSGSVAEPLLQHYGFHVRCLIAIPLLVIADAVSHGVTARLVPQILRAGIVTDAARFRETLTGIARLRDSTLPWVVLLGAVIAIVFTAPSAADNHELAWAGDAAAGFGFGGFWFDWVVRPVFTTLLLVWLWRLALAFVMSRRLARLELSLVPTHPDGAGGVGFLDALPVAFSPVVLALSTVLASRWAHDVVHHDVNVTELRLPMLAFAVVVRVLFLAPLLPWRRPLAAAKRAAVLDYGVLVAEHGRLVRRRWIEREPVGEKPLLSAPEIGPVADTIALYEAVKKMKPFPISRRSLIAILLPAAIPLVLVLAIEIPVKDLLLGLLKALT